MPGAVKACVVYVVEADESVRNGLRRVIESAGLESAPCESLDAFLAEARGRSGACAVLNISALRACAPALWARLRTMAAGVPVIALSSRDDPEMGRIAHELGARAFFRIPVDAAALLDSIDWVTRAEGGRPAAG
jgi:FixJ family two-component response regulator